MPHRRYCISLHAMKTYYNRATVNTAGNDQLFPYSMLLYKLELLLGWQLPLLPNTDKFKGLDSFGPRRT